MSRTDTNFLSAVKYVSVLFNFHSEAPIFAVGSKSDFTRLFDLGCKFNILRKQ